MNGQGSSAPPVLATAVVDAPSEPGGPALAVGPSERTELFREATVMVLYVAVVEVAELAAVPESHLAHGLVTGPTGVDLLAILWGTAVGLAMAHWFAFRFAAPAFRGEHVTHRDAAVGLAQLGGAVFVAMISSIPVLFLSDVRAQETTGDVPALLIAVVAYFVARKADRGRLASLLYATTALALGVVVALVKGLLAAH